ncbi:hypothetical protein NKG05_06490 [Oerskovia sp. M15]
MGGLRRGPRAGATTALAVAPAAFAAAEPVLPADAWVDQFDSAQLGSGWDVVNPVPSAWSLATTPGSLTLTSQTGDTYQDANSAKNVFMVDVPVGDFTVVTRCRPRWTRSTRARGSSRGRTWTTTSVRA